MGMVDFPIEPAGPAQGRVEIVGQVGGGDDDEILPLVESVHQGQELGDDTFFHVPHGVFPLGGDGVDLVQKDDRRAMARSLVEDFAQVRFRFRRRIYG